MAVNLVFKEIGFQTGDLGTESSVPSFLSNMISQNEVQFKLDEWDEIFEGYGRYYYSYPYREINTYSRKIQKRKVRIAILENDYLQATFLIGFGGRLWSLIDKNTGQNLIYTNDIIRYSNLSVRNAWFSGGVEWNIGTIGHTAMTTELLNAAQYKNKKGSPVLRMYGYERIRGLEYQMDFWLNEEDTFLNCRMRVVNSSKEVVPMYWWSNMATPEYEDGRVISPAKEAFTCAKVDGKDLVYKTDIPMIDGVDISTYNKIPYQVDYFFNIDKESPKYIANVNSDGYGLLHMSTDRLRGRKLFSWGINEGSDQWQKFLTEKAGRYVEIQAGLPQTQYGCLPLAPHTAWEWMEQYGPVVVADKAILKGPYEPLRDYMTEYVGKEIMNRTRIHKLLEETSEEAKKPASEVVCNGKSYGALKNLVRKMEGDRPLSPHLDYGPLEGPRKEWAEFLNTGVFMVREPLDIPEDFQCDELFYQKLMETIGSKENANNWYAHYQLSVLHLHHDKYAYAEKEAELSLELMENPWSYHLLALMALKRNDKPRTRELIINGIRNVLDNLSYVKEGFRILMMADGLSDIYDLYARLPEAIKADTRIQYDYMVALSVRTEADVDKAFDMLMANGGFVLDDLREGQDTLAELYTDLYEKKYGKKPESIPPQFNYHSAPPV